MPIASLPPSIPIHVEENGWPTGPGRSEESQVAAMREMVHSVNDFRGTYNVSDYRWFDLRDHRTSSANFQHHYGLLRDDYTPKPGFAAYRDLIVALARREAADPVAALRLRAYCSRRRVRVTLVGSGIAGVRSATLRTGSQSFVDRRRPFTHRFVLARSDDSRPLARVAARLASGRSVSLARQLRCVN
jgi:hypothetical protein